MIKSKTVLMAAFPCFILAVFACQTDRSEERVGIMKETGKRHGRISAPSLTPTYLRCEYRVNPVTDVTHPRLSWTLTSGLRSQVQSAYQILVASSEEQLQQDNGDLWNTGKVVDKRTFQIEYRGTPLTSRMRCFWTMASAAETSE